MEDISKMPHEELLLEYAGMPIKNAIASSLMEKMENVLGFSEEENEDTTDSSEKEANQPEPQTEDLEKEILRRMKETNQDEEDNERLLQGYLCQFAECTRLGIEVLFLPQKESEDNAALKKLKKLEVEILHRMGYTLEIILQKKRVIDDEWIEGASVNDLFEKLLSESVPFEDKKAILAAIRKKRAEKE